MKALALDARVILMDEPTGWLAASEVAKLHATIRALKARGVGIVYISHMLDEIFAVCDTMTIMRDGKVDRRERGRRHRPAARRGTSWSARSWRASPRRRRIRNASRAAPARFGCSAKNLGKRGVFRDVSFDLHAGEIFCITGLIGSKRTELMRTLFGSDRFDSGTLEVEGKPVAFARPDAGDGAAASASCPRIGIAKA